MTRSKTCPPWRSQFPVIVEAICTAVRNCWYDALKVVYGDEIAYQWWLEHEADPENRS